MWFRIILLVLWPGIADAATFECTMTCEEAAAEPTPTATPEPTVTPEPIPTPEPSALLQPDDLVFVGSFDLSSWWEDPKCEQVKYSLGAIAYKPDEDALFVSSHDHSPLCANLYPVPDDLSGSTTVSASTKRWAKFPNYSNSSRAKLTGLEWDGSKLCGTQFRYYNVSNDDYLDLACIDAEGHVSGPWEVGSNQQLGGPMAALGDDKYLLGLTGVPGAGGANFGPSAYEVDLSTDPPEKAVKLMTHGDTTREVMSDDEQWRTSMPGNGSVVIGDTLLWIVEEGERIFYGSGDEFKAEFGFQPRSNARGYHHDRYHPTIYFYSLADLEKARAGEIATTDVHPYAYHRLEPDVPIQALLGEMDVDTENRRIFLAQRRGSNGIRIHVYGY